MFVLRSSILLQVSKKTFGVINKHCDSNKKWGEGGSVGWKRIQKLTSGGAYYV